MAGKLSRYQEIKIKQSTPQWRYGELQGINPPPKPKPQPLVEAIKIREAD